MAEGQLDTLSSAVDDAAERPVLSKTYLITGRCRNGSSLV